MRGPRKVTSITEVMNMEQDIIIMQDVFRYKQLGIDQNGRAYGQFEATGVRPSFVNRLESAGIKLPSNLFQERLLLRDGEPVPLAPSSGSRILAPGANAPMRCSPVMASTPTPARPPPWLVRGSRWRRGRR